MTSDIATITNRRHSPNRNGLAVCDVMTPNPIAVQGDTPLSEVMGHIKRKSAIRAAGDSIGRHQRYKGYHV